MKIEHISFYLEISYLLFTFGFRFVSRFIILPDSVVECEVGIDTSRNASATLQRDKTNLLFSKELVLSGSGLKYWKPTHAI